MRVIRELLIIEYQSPSGRFLGMWSPDYVTPPEVEGAGAIPHGRIQG